MARRLELFYDYVSPYSYLADHELRGLRERTGAEIVYRPMLLGGVMNATGNSPPITVAPKGKYMFSDLQRWAQRYGIPLQFNPSFPINTVTLMRCALVALDEGKFAPFHAAMFHAMWAEPVNLGDESVAREVMDRAGCDGAAFLARSKEPEVKERLKKNTSEAVERGAFGAPTMFVGGEMFFGNDRLDFVEQALLAEPR